MSRRGEEGLSRTLGTRIVGVMAFNKAVISDIYDDEFSDMQAGQIVLMAVPDSGWPPRLSSAFAGG